MTEEPWVGALDLNKVQRLWPQRQLLFSQQTVNLSQITTVDSVGCAFLVQWARIWYTTPQNTPTVSACKAGDMRLYGVESR